MATKKNAPKHYYVVYGNEPFQREGYVRSAKSNFEKIGWEIEDCDPHDFRGSMFVDFLQPEKLLIVITMDNGDFDLDSFIEHLDNPEDGRCILLHHRGGLNCKKPFKDLVKKLGNKAIKYEKPSDWKYEEPLSQFAIKTAKGMGCELPPNLALAITRKVGADFGSMYFEIKKAVTLADCDNEKKLQPKHFKAFGSVNNGVLVDFRKAIENRNRKACLKALKTLKELSAHDPTMSIASSMQKRLLELEQVRNLHKRGIGEKNASAMVGMNTFVYKNLIPCVQRWGEDLPKLVALFAKSQRNVLSGNISPMAEFECGLIKLLK